MCGIVAYVGPKQAARVLLDGLKRLEYRGYDSAGVAVRNGRGIEIRKLPGRVANLERVLKDEPVSGNSGIAHTRWATHGPPNQVNSHPHQDCSGDIALIHNGIIENADSLRQKLTQEGHVFVTETDTEVVAHLVEAANGETLEEKVIAALSLVEGAYGLAVMWSSEPGKIVVARNGSPVLLGIGDGELFAASDASAVLEHTRSVVYLEDGDLATLTPMGYRIIDLQSRQQYRRVSELDWDMEAIDLGGYQHYMLKEIFEQPISVQSTLRGRLLFGEGTARLGGITLTDQEIKEISRILIVACGTSWHAGLVGRYMLEELAGIPVDVEYASEYRYRTPLPTEKQLTIAISQSGETADTLEALREAKSRGSKVVGIVNAVGSTIARETDCGLYLHCGPEIGVASTKAFTSQAVALMALAIHLGRVRGTLCLDRGRELVFELANLPGLISTTLEAAPDIKRLATTYADAGNFLYLGRGTSFPAALEGALKLKEISYIHAEGYPAAEMKHGPIALIDEEMPVVFVAPNDHLYAKVIANMQEVRARGGRIIAITTAESPEIHDLANHVIPVPESDPLISPILTSIPLQLLSYYIALQRGCDVDKPRNLAKSVTVE